MLHWLGVQSGHAGQRRFQRRHHRERHDAVRDREAGGNEGAEPGSLLPGAAG